VVVDPGICGATCGAHPRAPLQPSLTIGVGGAIFAVVDAVVLAPLPFEDPAALVTVGETLIDEPNPAPRAVGYATFEAWPERAGAMAQIEAYDGTTLTLTGLGPAERLSAANVTPGLLTLLRVKPALGRLFGPDDAAQPVAVLPERVSEAFGQGDVWRPRKARASQMPIATTAKPASTAPITGPTIGIGA
jgi:hypothetical protein